MINLKLAPKSGQLRHRLTFLKDNKTSDGAGGYITIKTTDFSLWGQIKTLNSNEQLGQGQEQGFTHYQIWVRYQSDMIPTRQHTISCNGVLYSVNAVSEADQLKKWVVIDCAKVDDGPVV